MYWRHKIARGQLTEAEREQRRIEIIGAAVREFAEHGYHQADVGQIASRAGVAKGTIYNYFVSKEDLFVGVIRFGIDQLVTQLKSISEQKGDPVARLRKAVLESLRFTERNLGFYRVLMKEAIHSCPSAAAECGEIHKAVLDVVEEIIKQCISSGQLSRMDSRVLAVMLYGLVDGVTMNAVLLSDKLAVNKSHRAIMRVFLDGTRKR